MAYLGRSTDGFGVRDRFVFTASGSETSVSGADDNSRTLKYEDGIYVDVFMNGVLLLRDTDYNTNTANTISGLASLACLLYRSPSPRAVEESRMASSA